MKQPLGTSITSNFRPIDISKQLLAISMHGNQRVIMSLGEFDVFPTD